MRNKWALIAMVLMAGSSIFAGAQRQAAPVNSSAAPVPMPIRQGTKAFISFELGDVSSFPGVYSGGPERAYNEFFQGMLSWGHYKLVYDPKDADVVFAIRYVDGGPYLRMQIESPQGVSLWGFAEQINLGIRKKTRDAAFSDAVAQIVDDVKKLVEQGAAPAPTQ